jgi:hypothetical protein
MRSRLWLVAALLLWLLPSPAAACERVPADGGARYEAASPPDAGDQVRAALGFEQLAVREQGRARWKTPRDTPPALRTRAFPEPAHLPSFIRAGARPAPRGSAPLCERLPYRATAPPLRG